MGRAGGAPRTLRRGLRPLAVVALAVAVLGWGRLAQSGHCGGFVPGPGARAGAPARRRDLVQGALAAGLICAGVGLEPRAAHAGFTKTAVTDKDLQNLAEGYKDMRYLMSNWNKVTRDCTEVLNNPNVQRALQAGTPSPDNCKATPDTVRRYLGMRNIEEKLYNTNNLWIALENTDLVPKKDGDKFQDAIEEFELRKREASDWAYNSAWGEANPGGGRDKVEDYLLRSKAEAEKAVEALGVIMQVLKLDA